MCSFDAADELRESEWIKIGVDTGAGKTAWPRVSRSGRRSPAKVISFYAQQLESLSSLTSNCTLMVVTIGERVSEFVVCKHRCANRCCLLVSTRRRVESVLYGNKGYMFHEGSTVAKKIDAWIQKELRDSQYQGCTIAYKENNVYNIYMKPRRNELDAMPLPGDSESGGSRPVPNL